MKTNVNGGMLSCSRCEKDVTGECVVYYTNDGDYVDETFILHKECHKPFVMHRNGYTHLCPKCQGEGSIRDNSLYAGLLISSIGTPQNNSLPCDLCDNKGYLKKAPIPVTKITEWKRDE